MGYREDPKFYLHWGNVCNIYEHIFSFVCVLGYLLVYLFFIYIVWLWERRWTSQIIRKLLLTQNWTCLKNNRMFTLVLYLDTGDFSYFKSKSCLDEMHGSCIQSYCFRVFDTLKDTLIVLTHLRSEVFIYIGKNMVRHLRGGISEVVTLSRCNL